MNSNIEINKEFYTVKEIMEVLQLSRLTIYRNINSWKLQTYKFWKNHRIRKEDLEKFIKEHKN